MTTPSLHESTGINIQIFKPTINLAAPSYTPRGKHIKTITSEIDSYDHEIAAVGGYGAASFSLVDSLVHAEDWLETGVGLHVEAHNAKLERIWEGFINEVSLVVGGMSATRGPLLDVANRVSLIYSLLDTTTTPPTIGLRTSTTIANNTDSQDNYGIIEQVLSAGGMITAEANQVRDSYLAEHGLPETSQQFVVGTAAVPSVTIKCLGYYHWFKSWVYQDLVSGTRQLDTKLGDILDADPNGMFSSANADIAANALLVPRYENSERKAWSIIKDLVAHGDANDDRYIFGIYNDFHAVYEEVPTAIEYYIKLTDTKQRIMDDIDTEIKPWDVRVGEWVLFSDFFVGRPLPATLREDPRAMFIESLQFTAPWGLTLNGGKVTTLKQKLSKLGLGGVAA